MELIILVSSTLVGGISGGVAVVLLAMLLPDQSCSECSKVLPRFRIPKNLTQLLWGGWTCPHCHAELNRRGQKVNAT